MNTTKKTILILCDWFLPGYLAGGPIQSIATLTKHLGNDINFKIITTDRDFKATTPYKNIETNCWTTFEGRHVFYISPDKLTNEFVLSIVKSTPHSALYLNSLFSKTFTIAPLSWKKNKLIESNIILTPRGMLGDGALAIKPLKKQLFLRYAKFTGLFKHIHWQSTSEQETAEIKKRISTTAIISQISNLPNAVSCTETIEKNVGELKLCFISRVSPIKNLNFAIDVLKKITQYTIIVDVYGPIEDDTYWKICKTNAMLLPPNITFTYKGILQPTQIGITLCKYHALFLPTQNENYGHIIVESLQHARPVILSNQTPWRNLQQHNVGADNDLSDLNAFVKVINEFCLLNQTDFNNTSNACVLYINEALNLNNIKKEYIKLFLN